MDITAPDRHVDAIVPGMSGSELRECLRDQVPPFTFSSCLVYGADQLLSRGVRASADDFLASRSLLLRCCARCQGW